MVVLRADGWRGGAPVYYRWLEKRTVAKKTVLTKRAATAKRTASDVVNDASIEASDGGRRAPREAEGFWVRRFDACVGALAAVAPHRRLREQSGSRGVKSSGLVQAHAFHDLTKWPSDPPTPSLYLMGPTGAGAILGSPKTLYDSANYRAMGIRNAVARGRACAAKGWIITEATLSAEQYDEDYDEGRGLVEAILAAWAVDEGVAVALLTRAGRVSLPSIMGMPWPRRGWGSFEVWYGA